MSMRKWNCSNLVLEVIGCTYYVLLLVYYKLLPINESGETVTKYSPEQKLTVFEKTRLLYKCKSYILSLKYREKNGSDMKTAAGVFYYKYLGTTSFDWASGCVLAYVFFSLCSAICASWCSLTRLKILTRLFEHLEMGSNSEPGHSSPLPSRLILLCMFPC